MFDCRQLRGRGQILGLCRVRGSGGRTDGRTRVSRARSPLSHRREFRSGRSLPLRWVSRAGAPDRSGSAPPIITHLTRGRSEANARLFPSGLHFGLRTPELCVRNRNPEKSAPRLSTSTKCILQLIPTKNAVKLFRARLREVSAFLNTDPTSPRIHSDAQI